MLNENNDDLSSDEEELFLDALENEAVFNIAVSNNDDQRAFLRIFSRRFGLDLNAALLLYPEGLFSRRGLRAGERHPLLRRIPRQEARQLVESMRFMRYQRHIWGEDGTGARGVADPGTGNNPPLPAPNEGAGQGGVAAAAAIALAVTNQNRLSTNLHNNCVFRQSRQQFLQSHVRHKFQPHSLKQQILLQISYKIFGQKSALQSSKKSNSSNTCGAQNSTNSNHNSTQKDENNSVGTLPISVQTLLQDYPLPRDLKAMVEQAVDQMTAWLRDNESLIDCVRGGVIHNWFRCFFNHVHWSPDNSQMIIDRKKTARMILSFVENTPLDGGMVENLHISPTAEFLLAASNSLENHVNRLWLRLDPRIRDHWGTMENLYNNPIISYWAAKCARNLPSLLYSLRQIIRRAIEKECPEYFDEFRRFWPEFKDKFSNQLAYHYDHIFHMAVAHGNLSIVCFLWAELGNDFQKRRSLLSSAACCGSRGAYHSFFCLLPIDDEAYHVTSPAAANSPLGGAASATTTTPIGGNQPPGGAAQLIPAPGVHVTIADGVLSISINPQDEVYARSAEPTNQNATSANDVTVTRGDNVKSDSKQNSATVAKSAAVQEPQKLKNAQKICDIFEFLWSLLADDERNCVMLIDHSSIFCRAALNGLYRIVYLMWTSASKNQRFVLMYQGNCAAFRESCALGHLEIVVLLWSSCTDPDRRQLMTVGQNAAFINACANNRPEIVSYLLNNMHESIKQFLFDAALSRALEIAVVRGHFGILYALKQATPVLQYVRFMLADDCALLKRCLVNGHVTNGGDGQSSSSKSAPTDEDHWAAEARWLLANSEYYEAQLKKMDLSVTSGGGLGANRNAPFVGMGGANDSARLSLVRGGGDSQNDEDMGFEDDD